MCLFLKGLLVIFPNNQIHLTAKSVMFFCDAKNTPLFAASDLGVITKLLENLFLAIIY